MWGGWLGFGRWEWAGSEHLTHLNVAAEHRQSPKQVGAHSVREVFDCHVFDSFMFACLDRLHTYFLKCGFIATDLRGKLEGGRTGSEHRQSMERILFRDRLSKLLAAPMDPMYT